MLRASATSACGVFSPFGSEGLDFSEFLYRSPWLLLTIEPQHFDSGRVWPRRPEQSSGTPLHRRRGRGSLFNNLHRFVRSSDRPANIISKRRRRSMFHKTTEFNGQLSNRWRYWNPSRISLGFTTEQQPLFIWPQKHHFFSSEKNAPLRASSR